MSKPRVIKDYDKLSEEIVEQIKLVYPKGFAQHLVGFTNKNGERRMGLPFETEDRYLLIRMSKIEAKNIVEDDEDFDVEGNLKESVKIEYEDKYEDESALEAFNANDDNDFGEDDDF